jgi:glutamate synthase domain-containing protein 1
VSADGRTGDGAGILLIFMIFFLKSMWFYYSKNERYAVGMVFHQKKKTKLILQDDFETAIRNQNLNIDGEMFLSMFQILDKRRKKNR